MDGPNSVYLRYRGSLKRVAVENVRLATDEELLGSTAVREALQDLEVELTGEMRPFFDERPAAESGDYDLDGEPQEVPVAEPVGQGHLSGADAWQDTRGGSGTPAMSPTRPAPIPEVDEGQESDDDAEDELQADLDRIFAETVPEVQDSQARADRLDGHVSGQYGDGWNQINPTTGVPKSRCRRLPTSSGQVLGGHWGAFGRPTVWS
jgi:hypothetical protein